MKEELFEDAEVWGGVEGGVEGEDRARAFETVSCKVELLHCVHFIHLSVFAGAGGVVGWDSTVLHVHFHGWSIRCLAHP